MNQSPVSGHRWSPPSTRTRYEYCRRSRLVGSAVRRGLLVRDGPCCHEPGCDNNHVGMTCQPCSSCSRPGWDVGAWGVLDGSSRPRAWSATRQGGRDEDSKRVGTVRATVALQGDRGIARPRPDTGASYRRTPSQRGGRSVQDPQCLPLRRSLLIATLHFTTPTPR
jgi:hypothetical protein